MKANINILVINSITKAIVLLTSKYFFFRNSTEDQTIVTLKEKKREVKHVTATIFVLENPLFSNMRMSYFRNDERWLFSVRLRFLINITSS